MKYTYRIIIALSAFLLGVVTFLYYQSLSKQVPNQIAPVAIEGQVTFRLQGCAGKHSVFILENQTGEAIYAPLQIGGFERWREFYDAGLELGMVIVEYQAPNSQGFNDVTLPTLKQPLAFIIVAPHQSVKFGVDLLESGGVYRVKAPYLELKDAVPILRTNESGALTVKDSERLQAAWKEAWSEPLRNDCP